MVGVSKLENIVNVFLWLWVFLFMFAATDKELEQLGMSLSSFFRMSYLLLVIIIWLIFETFLLTASTFDPDDLNLTNEGYGQIKAYAKSKLANILFTKELNRRFKGKSFNESLDLVSKDI